MSNPTQAAQGQTGTSGPQTVNPTGKPSKCFSAGSIAGAAVGAGIGAAILAALATWLVFKSMQSRRRKGRQGRNSREKASSPSPSYGVTPAAKTQDPYNWQSHLPQGDDDASIRQWIRTLFDQVDMHVINFYGDKGRISSKDQVRGLSRFNNAFLPGDLQALLTDAKHPTAIIKHCILQRVLASINPNAPTDTSLLPADFSSFSQAEMQGIENSTKQRDVKAQAYSQWRILTAYLRSDPSSDARFQRERDAKIEHAVAECAAFLPWANTSYSDKDRALNLAEILQNASDTGIRLFAQPAGFAFDWRASGSQRNEGKIVVAPAFLKCQDSRGMELTHPQPMVEKTLARF